jgi:hypothetical protein
MKDEKSTLWYYVRNPPVLGIRMNTGGFFIYHIYSILYKISSEIKKIQG